MARNRPENAQVYVGDLHPETTADDLRGPFEKFGAIRHVWVAKNPPGFGFVDFEDPRDARDCVGSMDGSLVKGSNVRVQMSRGRRAGRGGDSGGGRGGMRGELGGRGGNGGSGRGFSDGSRDSSDRPRTDAGGYSRDGRGSYGTGGGSSAGGGYSGRREEVSESGRRPERRDADRDNDSRGNRPGRFDERRGDPPGRGRFRSRSRSA